MYHVGGGAPRCDGDIRRPVRPESVACAGPLEGTVTPSGIVGCARIKRCSHPGGRREIATLRRPAVD